MVHGWHYHAAMLMGIGQNMAIDLHFPMQYLEKASRNEGKFTYVVESTTFNFFTKDGTSECYWLS